MYSGYLAIGGDALIDARSELINNDRAYAYVDWWNEVLRSGGGNIDGTVEGCIDWLEACDECPGYGDVFNPGVSYVSPISDPAPWYDPNGLGTERFLGLIGLDVQGMSDSTRQARVEQALGGGGAVGRQRFGPRTLVVRALAIAADACGMEAGLNWLRCLEGDNAACAGDTVWFLECCPDCARSDIDSPPIGPCWAVNYGQLLGFPPSCPVGTWWPDTYQQLLDGPPDETQWCRWIINYYELLVGLPDFTCKASDCIGPYVRQLRAATITEGPIVLSRTTMNRVGVIAEIEFTVVAADPHPYSLEVPVAAINTAAHTPVTHNDPPPPPAPAPDPFVQHVPLQRPPSDASIPTLPTTWARFTEPVPFRVRSTANGPVLPTFLIAANGGQVGPVRLRLLDADGDTLAGITIPFVPDGAMVEVIGRDHRVWTEHDGNRVMRNGFVRNHDGRHLTWPELTEGDYQLAIDVDPASTGSLSVEVRAAVQLCA